MLHVTFYTRSGCHICEDALAVVRAAQEETPFTLKVIDIRRDPESRMKYRERVPVVQVGDTELDGATFADDSFRNALKEVK